MTIPAHPLYQEDDLALGHIQRHDGSELIASYAAEETIGFGLGVQRGTDPEAQGKVFQQAAGVFAGVALYSPETSDIDNQQYLVNDALGVMTRGFVRVMCGEAVNAGDTVRLRHTASGGLIPGYFQKAADAGKTVLLEGAVWAETISASGVNTIKLNSVFKTTADV